MSAVLIRWGFMAIAFAVAILLVREAFSELSEAIEPMWVNVTLTAGAALLAVGIVLRVVGKTGKAVLGKRCKRCSRKVGSNGVYCADHLKESVLEARDQSHIEESKIRRR